MSKLTALLVVVVGLWPGADASAALIARFDFEDGPGDATTPDTGDPPAYDGTIHDAGVTYVPGKVGNYALDFPGANDNQYVSTGALASALGIDGNNPKTITAWAYTRAFNNAAPFELGYGGGSGGNDFSLRTRGGTDQWRAQFWGGADFDFDLPGSANNWVHLALVHDGSEGRAYANGLLVAREASTLATNDGQDFRIGSWHGNEFNGQVDDVRVYNTALTDAEIAGAMGYQIIEDFEGSGGAVPSNWYVSSGMSTTRLRTKDGPQGTYGMRTDGTLDQPAHSPNVYSPNYDNTTSMAWGQFFFVNDETASISVLIDGGEHAYNAGSQRNGGTGVALWDLDTASVIPGTFVTRTGNSGAYQAVSIPLAGLEGKKVGLVIIDRQAGGWAWTGADHFLAPIGSITPIEGITHHVVKLEYGFDDAGDFMGWQQVDGSGTPVPITSFRIGDTPGGLAGRHINQKGTFTVGEGFLSSTTAAGGWDAPTGTMRSPEFVLDGDIIEFYLAGGNRDDLSFELWVDVDANDVFTLQRTSRHQVDATEFDYDFWSIRDLAGLDAYLQLVDNNPGTWGHIHVDGIRMVAFAVPEPSTLAMLLGGLGAGLLASARRRRKTQAV